MKEVIFIATDEDFLKTYNIKLAKGLNFRGSPAHSSTILSDETAVRVLGLSSREFEIGVNFS